MNRYSSALKILLPGLLLATLPLHVFAQDTAPNPQAIVNISEGVLTGNPASLPVLPGDGTGTHIMIVSSPADGGAAPGPGPTDLSQTPQDLGLMLYSKRAQQMSRTGQAAAALDPSASSGPSWLEARAQFNLLIASTYQKYQSAKKQVSDRKLPYIMMNIFTAGGTLTWLYAAPFDFQKKAVIMGYQMAFQHFLFLNPTFWNSAVEVQAQVVTWLLNGMGIRKTISPWDFRMRFPAIFLVSTGFGVLNRLVNNYDRLTTEIFDLSHLGKDMLTSLAWVSSNTPWDHFSGRINAKKNPQAKKFFSYYDQVRWVAVVLSVMAAYRLGGEPVAMGLLFTHGALGAVANYKFERLVAYLDKHRWGDWVELKLNQAQRWIGRWRSRQGDGSFCSIHLNGI